MNDFEKLVSGDYVYPKAAEKISTEEKDYYFSEVEKLLTIIVMMRYRSWQKKPEALSVTLLKWPNGVRNLHMTDLWCVEYASWERLQKFCHLRSRY